MKIITHWLFLSLMWIMLTTLGFSLYIKHDWSNTILKYEEDFKEYRLDAKEFKLRFRRTPSPNIMWRFKYITEDTKTAFSNDEFKCLQDEKTCTKEVRDQLCERLQSFPNIKDCKSIDRIEYEFIALNRYMDAKIPPKKPVFKKHIESKKIHLIIFALFILIPPFFLFRFRKKLVATNPG